MSNPSHLKYTREHEWVLCEGGVATVGITEHAQEALGDVVYVELPHVGDVVTKDASFGSVESVKAVSDLFAPVSGKVVAVNEALKETPEIVNTDPYKTAWMIKIEMSHASEASTLLAASEYDALIS